MTNNFIKNYKINLISTLNKINDNAILQLSNMLINARNKYKTIFIMGNGGSAATASHFVGDLSKGALVENKPRFKAIGLTDNIPNITQWGNDINYESIFVEQLKNLLEIDDIVIGISGSGESKNVINAIKYANSIGAYTISITGYSEDNTLNKISKYHIHIPCDTMQVVEDLHMIIEHMITLMIHEEKK